jgi:hypothetical protein
MRNLPIVLTVVFTLGIASLASANENPLAPAIAGKIECFNPNEAAKTCDALTIYKLRTDGTFDEFDKMVLIPNPLVTTELKGVAFVQAGMICQKFTSDTLEQATFAIDGKPIDAIQLEALSPALMSGFKTFIGKTSCMRLTANPKGLIAEFEVDGISVERPGQYARWVDADEGYKLSGQ